MVQPDFLHLKLYKRQAQERRRDIYKKQPITSTQNKFLKTKTLFSDHDLDQDIRVFDDGIRADNLLHHSHVENCGPTLFLHL